MELGVASVLVVIVVGVEGVERHGCIADPCGLILVAVSSVLM